MPLPLEPTGCRDGYKGFCLLFLIIGIFLISAGPASAACTSDQECDDSKACTTDVCYNGTCSHKPKTAGTVCRAAAGGCDVAETCDGTSAPCPADTFQPLMYVCRPAAGTCDLPEACKGSSPSCPADFYRPATDTCRAAAGPCDQPEMCAGSSPFCPANSFTPSGTTCRAASSGACDVAETCTGTSAQCPADVTGNCPAVVGGELVCPSGDTAATTIRGPFELDAEGRPTYPPIGVDNPWSEGFSITFCSNPQLSYEVKFKFRGQSRRLICMIPPGEIKFQGGMPPFMRPLSEKIKLVYGCDPTFDGLRALGVGPLTNSQRDQWVLGEHLMYETMRVVGQETLNTAFARRLNLSDQDGNPILEGFGFFLEKKSDFAQRLGVTVLEAPPNNYWETRSPDDRVRFWLAEWLIANHEHSIGPPPNNLIPYQYPDGRISVAPYDFDFAEPIYFYLMQVAPLYDDSYSSLGRRIRSYYDNLNEEGRAAFWRVAPTFLSRRDQILAIANNPLLDPALRERLLVSFTAFLDALQGVLIERIIVLGVPGGP